MIGSFKRWVLRSKAVSVFYKLIFYFELGKNQTGRFYSFVPEIIIILGGIKYFFEVDINGKFLVFFGFFVVIFMTAAGFFLKKSGLFDVDRLVQASKDPVTKKILDSLDELRRSK